jgi:hypothetical protein
MKKIRSHAERIIEMIDEIHIEHIKQTHFMENIELYKNVNSEALRKIERNRLAISKEKESHLKCKINAEIKILNKTRPEELLTWRFTIDDKTFNITDENIASDLAQLNPTVKLMCIDESGAILDEQMACDIFYLEAPEPIKTE